MYYWDTTLAVAARKKGIGVFEADVLAENEEMMKVFRDSGFEESEELEDGVYRMIMNIATL